MDDGDINQFDYTDEDYDIQNISNEDLICFAFNALKKELSGRNDEDYEVNQPQMDKYIELYRFFFRVSKEFHGVIEPIKYSPKEEHGDIVVHFNLIYLFDGSVQEFSRVMSYASAFDISATLDGVVCMSIKVPNIFKKKQ